MKSDNHLKQSEKVLLMQLWTIQTEGWFEDLMSKKKKFASYSRVWHDFKPHYKWMAQQMADRIGTQPCPMPHVCLV